VINAKDLPVNNKRIAMFYLMRHAEAAWSTATDIERPLTLQGEAGLRNSLAKNITQLQKIQRIVASPYLRTQQTAKIVAACLSEFHSNTNACDRIATLPIISDKSFTPSATINEAYSAIEGHWCENLLVVTHQPLIGNLIGYFEGLGYGASEPVAPGSIYEYTMEWPGPGCALRQSLFAV
jgi:phosphohistidine phosphatase